MIEKFLVAEPARALREIKEEQALEAGENKMATGSANNERTAEQQFGR